MMSNVMTLLVFSLHWPRHLAGLPHVCAAKWGSAGSSQFTFDRIGARIFCIQLSDTLNPTRRRELRKQRQDHRASQHKSARSDEIRKFL